MLIWTNKSLYVGTGSNVSCDDYLIQPLPKNGGYYSGFVNKNNLKYVADRDQSIKINIFTNNLTTVDSTFPSVFFYAADSGKRMKSLLNFFWQNLENHSHARLGKSLYRLPSGEINMPMLASQEKKNMFIIPRDHVNHHLFLFFVFYLIDFVYFLLRFMLYDV